MAKRIWMLGVVLALGVLVLGLGCEQLGEAIKEVFGPEQNEPPRVSLSANPPSGQAPLTVYFTAHASDPDGEIRRYEWDFGDGMYRDGGRYESYTYHQEGHYVVMVRVEDDKGDVAHARADIEVQRRANQPPNVSLTANPPSGPPPLNVSFTAHASDPDGDPLQNWWWDFGDGFSQTGGDQASHTYQNTGYYMARVGVDDDRGGHGEAMVTIIVQQQGGGNQPPQVQLTANPPSGSDTLTVYFQATAWDPDGGDITRYEWDFTKDGSVDTTTSVGFATHTYTVGTYTAVVRVQDDEGTWTNAEVYISVYQSGGGQPSVNQPPSVYLSANPNFGFAPLMVWFTATGSDPDGQIQEYRWDFGDGNKDTTTWGSNSHTYNMAGNYTAKVTAVDDSAATAQDQVSIQVQQQGGTQPPHVTLYASPPPVLPR